MSFILHEKNDAINFVKTEGFDHLDEDMIQLDRNLIKINYVNDLTNIFMDHTGLDLREVLITIYILHQHLKITITKYPIVELNLNFFR